MDNVYTVSAFGISSTLADDFHLASIQLGGDEGWENYVRNVIGSLKDLDHHLSKSNALAIFICEHVDALQYF